MDRDYTNRLIEVCLNIADYYDEKLKEDGFLGDELTEYLGLWFRSLTTYLRSGARDFIKLKREYYWECERAKFARSSEKEVREYVTSLFGDSEPETLSDKYQQRIKNCVQEILDEIDEGAGEKE